MVQEIGVQSQVVIQKTKRTVLDTALLSTQHYKVRIKDKVEQSREWSSALPYILALTKVTNSLSTSTQFTSIWPIDKTIICYYSGARVDLEERTMKRCSAFPKAPALLEPHHQLVSWHIQDTRWVGEVLPSVEKQSVYSTAPANWTSNCSLFSSCLISLV